MNAEQKHAKEAGRLIVRAQSDLERGDRLDAIDSLTIAIQYLRKSRTATELRLMRAGRAVQAQAGA